MQKILCKSTTSSTPVLSTPVNSFAAGFISLGFKSSVKNLTPFSTLKPFSISSMPTRTASISPAGASFSTYLQKNRIHTTTASLRFSSARYRPCRCSIDCGIRSTSRAWVGRTGTWRALFCSDSNGGLSTVTATGALAEGVESSDGEDDEGEKDSTDKDEKPVRISRRNRSSANGNGEFVGNPDLLKIPGVGLRNQRKLVDNGIGDVAELKKLYKDKVFLKKLQFLTVEFEIIEKKFIF